MGSSRVESLRKSEDWMGIDFALWTSMLEAMMREAVRSSRLVLDWEAGTSCSVPASAVDQGGLKQIIPSGRQSSLLSFACLFY